MVQVIEHLPSQGMRLWVQPQNHQKNKPTTKKPGKNSVRKQNDYAISLKNIDEKILSKILINWTKGDLKFENKLL
jgi:hypothetical protein